MVIDSFHRSEVVDATPVPGWMAAGWRYDDYPLKAVIITSPEVHVVQLHTACEIFRSKVEFSYVDKVPTAAVDSVPPAGETGKLG
jgi:hypothetical protein